MLCAGAPVVSTISPAPSRPLRPTPPLAPHPSLSSVYELLRKMRFFRHFWLIRAFKRWRANVKRSAFERTREAVAQRLFGALPVFVPTLATVGRLLQAMRDTPVVAVRGSLAVDR